MDDNTVNVRWSMTWSQRGQVVAVEVARVVVAVAGFPPTPLYFDLDTGKPISPSTSRGDGWPRIDEPDLQRIKVIAARRQR